MAVQHAVAADGSASVARRPPSGAYRRTPIRWPDRAEFVLHGECCRSITGSFEDMSGSQNWRAPGLSWRVLIGRYAKAAVNIVGLGLWLLGCADESTTAEVEEVQPSQGASELCNPDFGIDACGAGLFCEAFDGRKYHTCYILGSRLIGDECSSDEHCVTKNCEGDTCGGAPLGAACATDFDCASNNCGSFKTCLEP